MASGQLDNTYIVFASDNGYHMGQHRMLSGKGTAYEEDIHVPLIVRGPGVPAGVVRGEMTSMVDLAPTLAEIAGAALPVTPDGRSLLSLLHNLSPAPAWRQMTLVDHYNTTSRTGFDIGGSWEPPDPLDDQLAQLNPPVQLYSALRNFLDGDRLTTIPASASKRLVVLRWLAEKFEFDVTYPERTVNEMLRQHHADYAALRRYLVDAGLLQREQGMYWRTGEAGPENVT